MWWSNCLQTHQRPRVTLKRNCLLVSLNGCREILTALMELRRQLWSLWGSLCEEPAWKTQVSCFCKKTWLSKVGMIEEQLGSTHPSQNHFLLTQLELCSVNPVAFKETGQTWCNRCSCLCTNSNDTLFGTRLDCSCWLQGPSVKPWIQILWIYHTHWTTLALQASEWIILFH